MFLRKEGMNLTKIYFHGISKFHLNYVYNLSITIPFYKFVRSPSFQWDTLQSIMSPTKSDNNLPH
jgi:hypothetical protein